MMDLACAEPYVPAGAYVNVVTCGGARDAATFERTDLVRADSKTKSQLTPQEALIYAMVTVAAADRTISENELARINTMVRELPAFRGLADTWLSHEAQNCGKVLARPEGVENVVRMIAEALPPGLHETAYALAAEVAASDMAIEDDERNFLTLLADALQLDPLVRAALERGASARHRAV
jgi:uncharacterized membrane protein YebE (DUF533 family)